MYLMERVSFFNFLFSIIPRSMVAIYFCQTLLQTSLKSKKFIFSSFLFAIITWTSRAYLPMGYHSLLSSILLTLLLWYFTKTHLSSTFSVVIIYFILLYIFDFFVIYIYHLYTNFTLFDIWSLDIIRVLLTLPASIIFIVISLFVKRRSRWFFYERA